MAKKKQTGIIIYPQWDGMIQTMDSKSLGDLIKALADMAWSGIEYSGDDVAVSVAYSIIAPEIKKNSDKYDARCNTNKKIAQNRYNKPNVKNSKIEIDASDDVDAF